MSLGQSTILPAEGAGTTYDLEGIFRLHYPRIARLIARILRDPGRAEELAVEVFLRWRGDWDADALAVQGWLSRTAVRLALDELRRQRRHGRFAWLTARLFAPRDPDELARSGLERTLVMDVLAKLKPRDSELLLLRAEGLSYEELGTALGLHTPSIGKFVSRAQDAFRKEYLKRNGTAT